MKDPSPWKALAHVYISMLAFALTFQAIPPLLSFIIPSLGISSTQAGALMSFFALPGILISIPGGILTDIYGPRPVGIVALILALIGSILVALGNSFSLLAMGRIIAGIGSLTIAIIAPQTISRWVAPQDLGKAMGIFNTAMPVGTIVTLNVFGRLALAWNWRIPILLTVLYTLFVLALFYFQHPGLPQGEEPKGERRALGPKLAQIGHTGWPIWLVAFIWMMYNAAAISYLTFAAEHYIAAGFNVAFAGFLTSLFMMGSLVFSPLVGYLTDKIGRGEYFIIGAATILAVLLFLVPRTALNPMLLGTVIGLVAAFIPAPVFSLVSRCLPPAQAGLGYGILSTCLNVGVLLGPLLVGLSYDRRGDYLMGFSLMALFALAAGAIALLLLFVQGKESSPSST
ncbi:MAG: MFS transporter [Limnochordia bacterium]|jgi:predicted MFS family arabinose efflux permease